MRVVQVNTLENDLEDSLTPDELNDLLLLDLLVKGQLRNRPDIPQVWLALEISSVVDQSDVARAERRAALLRRAGYPAIPVVAGERAVADIESVALAARTAVLQDGRVLLWDEALTVLG